MNESSRLKLPYIFPGQAQKELFHNEALQRLDVAVQAVADGYLINDPPQQPTQGSGYIIGPTPSGKWRSYSHHLASFSEAGWIFVPPFEGMTVTITPGGQTARYAGGDWVLGVLEASEFRIEGRRVLGGTPAYITQPTGGSTIDIEARQVLSEIVSLLKANGLAV